MLSICFAVSANAEPIEESKLIKARHSFDAGDYRDVLKTLHDSKSDDSWILRARAAELLNKENVQLYLDFGKSHKQGVVLVWFTHSLILERDFHNAQVILNRQIKYAPPDALTHAMMGDCLCKAHQTKLAFNEFSQAQKLGTNLDFVFEKKADCHLANLQIDMALQSLDAWSTALPKMVRSYTQKAEIYNLSGRPQTALLECKKALAINNQYQHALSTAAEAEYLLEHYPNALEYGEKSLKADPNSDDARSAHRTLARVFEQQKKFKSEIEQLQFLLNGRLTQGYKLTGQQIENLLSRGQAYLALGQTKAALNDAQEVINARSESSSAHLLKARILNKSENYSDSLKEYKIITNSGLAPSFIVNEEREVLQHLRMAKEPNH